ncbi:hypothetical protein [Pseudoruegeria sp. HB172150]|uniref:hypothetical protein n=1 Tax=Pseudoruegeria sp. HB172150 TaxID=2721164 RepID=UPI0015536B28|nr:hypothetical protein [Pseudoruegeria sp. HB172150]
MTVNDDDVLPEPMPVTVDRSIFLNRLSEEISGLGAMSAELQEAIHNLPLTGSDSHTRQVLQSADMLTQSLVCLSAAVHGLSDLPVATHEYDLTHVLDGVFLEDMRDRLTTGLEASSGRDRAHPGKVELF